MMGRKGDSVGTTDACAVLAALLSVYCHSVPAVAAEFIKPADPADPAFGCEVLMRGEIERDDLDKLEAFYEGVEWPRGPFCLDSTGRDWGGAIDIANWVFNHRVGTFVGRGAECLSACAVIFMAGSSAWYDWGHQNRRAIHVGGKVGFHAPRLIVPDRPPKDIQELRSIYNQAISDVQNLLALIYDMDFSKKLASEMFNLREKDEFFFIDSTMKASFFGIDLVGYRAPRINVLGMANACVSFHIRNEGPGTRGKLPEEYGSEPWREVYQLRPDSITHQTTNQKAIYLTDNNKEKVVYDDVHLVTVENYNRSHSSSCKFRVSKGHHEVKDTIWGGFTAYRPRLEEVEIDFFPDEPDTTFVDLWRLYPVGTPLSDIVAPAALDEFLADADAIRALQDRIVRNSYTFPERDKGSDDWPDIGSIDGEWGPKTERYLRTLAGRLGIAERENAIWLAAQFVLDSPLP